MPEAASFVFVLGTGRCGSTMVEEVLARHPAAGFISNLEDRASLPPALSAWNGRLYRRVPPALTRKGRFRYAPSEGYRILDRKVSPILSTPFRDLGPEDAQPWLAQRLRRFFEERAAAQGTPVFLHKFTGWPRAGLLAAVFPEARFIHVVRDGRAVANSWLQMSWWQGYQGPDHWQWGPLPKAYEDEWRKGGRGYPLLAGILWKLLLDAHDRASSRLDAARWLEVRYEDVVARPAESFRAMLDFAGLAADPRFDAALARQPFETGRTEAFRRDQAPATVEELTASLRPHLEKRGYRP